MGAIATFPLLVPPFFLPLFTASLGMSSGTGAGVVAAFNFSSALGRLLCGLCSDFVGPLNTLFISLLLSALSMLIIWPISTSLGPLIVFVIVNGMANGGFFSTMPTVVGNTFGSARVSVVMGMVVTGWAGGYLLVSLRRWNGIPSKLPLFANRVFRVHQLPGSSSMRLVERTMASPAIVQLSSMLAR